MQTNQELYHQLLGSGVHYGHLRRKWNPKMAPYIFMERKGIHIVDLHKTIRCLHEAASAARQMAYSGRKILFVATKKQAKKIAVECAIRVNMPYITERWLGGMLTNFSTIRKSIKKMETYTNMEKDGTFDSITKKERLRITRDKEKLSRALGGIANLNRLPSAIYIVDIIKEHIAVSEAQKLNITTIAMVDTNADPSLVDFPIPANDDASRSIETITRYITDAIQEGLEERKKEKDAESLRQAASGEEAGEDEAPKPDQRESRRGRRSKQSPARDEGIVPVPAAGDTPAQPSAE